MTLSPRRDIAMQVSKTRGRGLIIGFVQDAAEAGLLLLALVHRLISSWAMWRCWEVSTSPRCLPMSSCLEEFRILAIRELAKTMRWFHPPSRAFFGELGEQVNLLFRLHHGVISRTARTADDRPS